MNADRISNLAVIVILAVALGLIFLFYIGVGLNGTLQVSEVARSLERQHVDDEFAKGLIQLRAQFGIRSMILALPMSILYAIGGVNEVATQVISVGATVVNLLLVSFLAKNLYGKKAAWIVGFLFAVMPATIFTATALPFTQPAISLAFSFLLLYFKKGWTKKGLRFGGLLLVTLALIFLDVLLFACVLLLVAILETTKSKKLRFIWLPLAFIGTGLLLGTGGKISRAFIAFYESMVQLPEMEVLLPVFIIVITIALNQSSRQNNLALGLLGSSFLSLLLRFSVQGENWLIADPLFSLFIVAPLFLLGGLFSSHDLDLKENVTPFLTPLAFLGVSWLAVSGQRLLIPSYSELSWISSQAVIPLLSILPGPVILLFIAFAFFFARGRKKAALFLSISLPFLLAASLVPSTWQRWHETRPSILAITEANELLTKYGWNFPVYVVEDAQIMSHLQYIWNDTPPSPIHTVGLQTVLEAVQNEDGAYILYWEDQIQNLPSSWWQMDNFGALGQPRLVVARALDETRARRLLNENIASASTSKEDFELLYGAAINANQLCQAIAIWMDSQYSGKETPSYFPLFDFPIDNCSFLSPGENLVAGQPPVLYPGYSRINYYLGEERNLQEGAAIGPKYPFFEDPRIFFLEVSLQPDTIYTYHVQIRGPEAIMPLYWKIGDEENYLDYGFYPSWTSVTLLFSTHGWDEKPLTITLLPYMYNVTHYGGAAELRDLQLFAVSLENQTK